MGARFVVWDLDGTLIDSGADIAAAANAARIGLGLAPLAEPVIRGFIGEGAKRLVDQVVGETQPDDVKASGLELFFAHYGENLLARTKPYPGIDRLVRALAGRQGIATNKPARFSHRLVEALGWTGLFRSVVGGGDVPNRKPAPDAVLKALELAGVDRRDCVFVGDSPIDIRTAEAAGVDFVCVSWGLRPRHELLDAPVIVDTVDELEEALLRLDGGSC